jgi:hypothetical protein
MEGLHMHENIDGLAARFVKNVSPARRVRSAHGALPRRGLATADGLVSATARAWRLASASGRTLQ